jgi:glyceraldehyde 3-phosphate dehydrogenase
VIGVNEDTYDPAHHHVVSNASCTTNCFVPMVKVLDDAFGVDAGLMTTIHAYTNDQNLLDLDAQGPAPGAGRGDQHRAGLDRRGARDQPGAGLDEGPPRRHVAAGAGATGSASPTSRRSCARPASRRSTRPSRAAADGPAEGRARLHRRPIVSSDIVGSPASCTFDSLMTMVQRIDDDQSLVKIFGWYDNEWGYSNRLVDLTVHIGK